MGDPTPNSPAALEAAKAAEKKENLRLFREEIAKVKLIDETLFKVENPENLEPSEMKFWDKWKVFFKSLDDFFVGFTLEQCEEKKSELEDFLLKLAVFTNEIKNREKSDQTDRKEFIYWVNNRIFGINSALELFLETGSREDLNFVKKFIEEEKPKVSF